MAILIDGTPSVIIIPHLFAEEFQSVDDYSNRPYYAAFIRILKYISFLIAVFFAGNIHGFCTVSSRIFSDRIARENIRFFVANALTRNT